MSEGANTASRRTVLVGVAVATVAVVTTGAVLTRSAAAAPAQLGALTVGDTIAGATVVAIHPPHYGAVPIVLRTAQGVHFQVDVLARDPQGPRGVAETAALALFVANRGDGATATDETQGLTVMALAARLDGVDAVPGLLTLRERNAQHPSGAFGVPLS